MTQVGKILVLVIMAFSLMFLGISTMVFTTSKNWKTETQKKAEEVTKIKKALQDEQARVAAASKELADAKSYAEQEKKSLESRLRTLEDTNKRDLLSIEAVRKDLVVAEQSAKTALDEVEARRKETMALREQKAAVEKQANQFQLRQAELNDRIRELERMLDTATKNNSDLRERVAKYTTLLHAQWAVRRHHPDQGTGESAPGHRTGDEGQPHQQAAGDQHRLRRRTGRRS